MEHFLKLHFSPHSRKGLTIQLLNGCDLLRYHFITVSLCLTLFVKLAPTCRSLYDGVCLFREIFESKKIKSRNKRCPISFRTFVPSCLQKVIHHFSIIKREHRFLMHLLLYGKSWNTVRNRDAPTRRGIPSHTNPNAPSNPQNKLFPQAGYTPTSAQTHSPANTQCNRGFFTPKYTTSIALFYSVTSPLYRN